MKEYLFLLGILFCACSAKPTYYKAATDNPVFIKNTIFSGEEYLSLPRFSALKIKYRLDTVLGSETDEWNLKNKAADILMVCGTEKKILSKDPESAETAAEFAQTFSWLEWDVYTNRFSAFPHHEEKLLMYRDSFFNQHTWLWKGKPHWAYNTPFVQYIDQQEPVYWTPDTVFSTVTIHKDQAHIVLTSETPNFNSYQCKKDNTDSWEPCDSSIVFTLNKMSTDLYFRTLNRAGVPGAVHHLQFKWKS